MRDYDPTTGRYLQADPLGLVDGASVYGYARQSPARWTDPRGELTLEGILGGFFGGLDWGGAAVGGIAGAGVGGVLGILLIPSEIGDGTIQPGVIPAEGAKTTTECDCSPSTSPIWQSLFPYQDKTKTNALPGKARRFFQWDYTHCNIEVYDRRGKHVGVKDPQTGAMVGPGVPGRKIKL